MIPTKALLDLRNLLSGWGIKADDWYVTGEAAMLLSDYPTEFRHGQMDILVCRDSWPWSRPEEQVSLLPDKDTPEDLELQKFINEHKIMPDFHPLPHVGIRAEDRFKHSYWLPDETGVRVLKPWAGVYHRKLIVEFYENNSQNLSLDVFDQAKFSRWKKFVADVYAHAKKINDLETVDICLDVLPVIDRAIQYFEKGPSTKIKEDILQGKCAYPGQVRAEAQFWSPQASFKEKIAVLTHSLPEQISLLREAAGIITDQGGTLSHAAIIAREFQIPTVIGTKTATKQIKENGLLEMDATNGIVKIL